MRSSLTERIVPILWAIHPVLFLASTNLRELVLIEVLRPLLLAILLAVVAQVILSFVFRPSFVGSLITTLAILLFFSYGHVYDLVKGVSLATAIIGRHRFLAPAYLAVFTMVAIGITRLSSESLASIARVLALASIAALVLPIASLATFAGRTLPSQEWEGPRASPLQFNQSGPPPDIYYIILDSYARGDVMEQVFEFDNSRFESELEARGFFIASESIPNHVATGFSVVSSLNMDYVPNLPIELPPGSYPGPLIDPIRDSTVRRQLSSLGYLTVATSSGWAATSLINADVYLSPELGIDSSDRPPILAPTSSFESLLLETTLLRAPMDYLAGRQTSEILARLTAASGVERHRRLVLSTFEHLHTIPTIDGPKFVFVHLVSPHRPYVFDSAGNLPPQTGPFTFEENSLSDDMFQEFVEYREQLLFINEQVIEAIDAILAIEQPDPIILIQADTGPAFGFDWSQPDPINLELKSSMLSAYRLPSGCNDDLYASISPVNSFRVIFNCVFGAKYPLLDDVTLFTDHHSMDGYQFQPIDRTDFTLDPPLAP